MPDETYNLELDGVSSKLVFIEEVLASKLEWNQRKTSIQFYENEVFGEI